MVNEFFFHKFVMFWLMQSSLIKTQVGIAGTMPAIFFPGNGPMVRFGDIYDGGLAHVYRGFMI